MNALNLVKTFCRRTNLPVPAACFGSSDDHAIQIVNLLNEVLDYLVEKKSFQFVTKEATHTTLAQEDQGNIHTIASSGFMFVKGNYLFNRSTGEMLVGPKSSSDWQASKAGIMSISSSSYRIRGNKLLISPAPSAGQTIAFEYVSNYLVTDSTGATERQYFEYDSDISPVPDKILLSGLRWIWRREKGLRYQEFQRDFEIAVANLAGNDGTNEPVRVDNSVTGVRPGVIVPEMNWSV